MAREFLHVDPATLRLPHSRAEGADRGKYWRHVSRHGASLVGMPPLKLVRDGGGLLRINDGVTRAVRAAKMCPGRTVPAEVIAAEPRADFSRLNLVGDRLP